MKNTMDAIKYGLETMNITPKEMFNLIESSKGYDGDDYNRWLSNEIIKIAERDGVGYSQLLAKWFNIIGSITEEYSDDSIKEYFENKILEMIKNTYVYTVGITGEDNTYGEKADEVDWGNKVDLPFNYDFLDTIEMGEKITDNVGVTIFVKFNPKSPFKKSSDLVSDAKLNGVPIRNHDALMMYRMCTIVRALDDMCSNFKFVFMTDTKFLYSKDNEEIIKYFLSFFNYKGFVVNSKDLYTGSFTSEEYAICECSVRGISDNVQNGFLLGKDFGDGNLGTIKRYSMGTSMLDTLYKGVDDYAENVPMIDREYNVVGVCKGVKNAYGYLCKGVKDRNALLTCYPLKDTKYIAITDENLMKVIAYYGVTQSMDNSGMSVGISDIIDGHPDYDTLVSNCVPIFLFDVNSKFCDLGVVKNKSGKDVRLSNKFDLSESSIVTNLMDKSSVYFSYEAKELVDVCNKFIELSGGTGSKVKSTFEDIRGIVNNDSLNKIYFSNLSRCKDFVSSLYRNM